MTTIYDVAGASEAAETAIYDAMHRISDAMRRHAGARVPSPLAALPPLADDDLPALPDIRGYGMRYHGAGRREYATAASPNSTGSVAGAIMEALTPSELACLLRRADAAAERWEELSAAREAAVQAAVEAALRSEDAALREIIDRAPQRAAAWIRAHGSERLRRLLAEGIEHGAVYRDERIALDRPGWMMEPREMLLDEPRNPPAEALDLLDRARQTAPDAKLAYYRVYRDAEEDEEGDRDGRVLTERGYVARAAHIGESLVTVERLVL